MKNKTTSNKQDEARSASAVRDCPDSAGSVWIVRGVAFVPVQIECHVSAPTKEGALLEAAKAESAGILKDCIVANSQDDSCVFDFEPIEAQLLSQNSPVHSQAKHERS